MEKLFVVKKILKNTKFTYLILSFLPVYLYLELRLTRAKLISSSPSLLGSRSLTASPETSSSETTTKEKNMFELFFLKQNTVAVSTE